MWAEAGPVKVAPITEAEVAAVARFLNAEMNQQVTADAWAGAMHVPWTVDAPNFGFYLRDDAGEVVGAYLAFYSVRMINGQPERICNLGAWCVRPEYRFGGMRLLQAMLAQPGFHFTDLSPSGSVVPLNVRLKFEFLDTTTAMVANLPWPTVPGRRRISTDPAVLRATLTGDDRERYLDHADAAAARHLLIRDRDEHCHVIYRRVRRKRLPLFASILYVSNPALFQRAVRSVTRHLLLRHGVLATLAELRVVGARPGASVIVRDTRRKMYKSASLKPDEIDNLYSELVCVAW